VFNTDGVCVLQNFNDLKSTQTYNRTHSEAYSQRGVLRPDRARTPTMFKSPRIVLRKSRKR
jgi:hypothetical protein